MYVKDRLIRMFQETDKPLAHRNIVRAFDESRRAEAERHLSDMLSAGLINQLGIGKRGSPIRYNRSLNWPTIHCPTCGQSVQSLAGITQPRELVQYRKRGDTCRPCLRFLPSTQEYVVYGRRTLFEKKGAELLRTKNKEAAQARLKEIEETES